MLRNRTLHCAFVLACVALYHCANQSAVSRARYATVEIFVEVADATHYLIFPTGSQNRILWDVPIYFTGIFCHRRHRGWWGCLSRDDAPANTLYAKIVSVADGQERTTSRRGSAALYPESSSNGARYKLRLLS